MDILMMNTSSRSYLTSAEKPMLEMSHPTRFVIDPF